MESEQRLEGGNASGDVVKVGNTVRKPWTASTPSVHGYMRFLLESGIDTPAVMGRDDDGRQVLEYLPGRLALDIGRLSHDQLSRVGELVRSIHDASASFTPPLSSVWSTAISAPGDELVCHNDLAPWNLIIGERWAFIDWDASAPSTRLWDLAYSAQTFTLNDPLCDPSEAAADLVAFINGYDADPALRSALPTVMHRRAAAMLDLLGSSHANGVEPWATMYESGHGTHWHAVRDYVGRNHGLWRDTLREA